MFFCKKNPQHITNLKFLKLETQQMQLKKPLYLFTFIAVTYTYLSNNCFSQTNTPISPQYQITLNEAHIGNLAIDTMLLNSYSNVPSNIKNFYLDCRNIFERKTVHFSNKQIVEAALNNDISLMTGPLLGDLKPDGISILLRPSSKKQLNIKITEVGSKKEHKNILNPGIAGKEQRVIINGLSSKTAYNYQVLSNGTVLSEGSFLTPPDMDDNDIVRIAFGSGFHKIGIHNPNLINTVLERKPHAMMLLGDLAVDDRKNNFSMHRSDYLLRDVSSAWKQLSGNVPLYASWDDHDYLDNDLSGVPNKFSDKDRSELRKIWEENWNNPQNKMEGVFFNTRIGQVEVIMLDTRSCRNVEKRGQHGSYLGTTQLNWLKEVLENSTAQFKIISSGTMWSDYISNGKDSWGTWDTLAREEIYRFIEKNKIPGVLLISGDRHGARGFKIPRTPGFNFYEFEVATLGGVPGPPAMAKDTTNQLFGYPGQELRAFGEFTFNPYKKEPKVTFRLINEFGEILEEHTLNYESLTPKEQ